MEIYLPPTIDPHAGMEFRDKAIGVLEDYFAPLRLESLGPRKTQFTGYTGGQWDVFDPSGTRAASANVFTCDDIVACSLLSIRLDGNAAMQLLTRPEFAELLAEVGGDIDFAHLETLHCAKFQAVRKLYASSSSCRTLERRRPPSYSHASVRSSSRSSTR